MKATVRTISVVVMAILAVSMVQADMILAPTAMTATGNGGLITSITHDGTTYVVADGDLVTGTTTRYETDGTPYDISPYFSIQADDFDLDDMTTLDPGGYLETIFTVPAQVFFITENGLNNGEHDPGQIQGLDINGDLVGSAVSFLNSDYYQSSYLSGMGRLVGVLGFVTDAPVYGIRIFDADGMDQITINATPEPATIGLLSLGALLALRRKRG